MHSHDPALAQLLANFHLRSLALCCLDAGVVGPPRGDAALLALPVDEDAELLEGDEDEDCLVGGGRGRTRRELLVNDLSHTNDRLPRMYAMFLPATALTFGLSLTHAGLHPRKRNPIPSFLTDCLSLSMTAAAPPSAAMILALITSAGLHTVVATVPARKLALKWSHVPSL